MAATPPPGYTPPPADLPQRGDRATFSNRVDAWVTWFSTVILTQLTAMIANAYANALDAYASATAALGYRDTANTAATAAQSARDTAQGYRDQAAASAAAAAASAAAAATSAAALVANSTSSVAVGAGAKTFTVPAGKQFPVGMPTAIASTGTPANKMFGTVTSYSGTTLVIAVTSFEGSGTNTDWVITPGGAQGPIGGTAGGNLTSALNELKGSDLASAVTIDPWATGGNFMNLTGTATITAVANAPQAGAKRTLLVVSNPKITAGANLVVKGGSLSLLPGDEIDIEAETTTKFRITVRRADGSAVSPTTFRGLEMVLSSAAWQAKTTGVHRITLSAASGSGGLAVGQSAAMAVATGGSAGGTVIKSVFLNAGDTLNFVLGANGASATYGSQVGNVAKSGNDAADSSVTGPGISLTAGGGKKGNGAVGTTGTVSALGAVGGSATGGDINLIGGGSGTASTAASGTVAATGGGANAYKEAGHSSGQVVISSGAASGSAQASGGASVGADSGSITLASGAAATGGAGCFGASPSLTSAGIGTGGAGVPAGFDTAYNPAPLRLVAAGTAAANSTNTSAPTAGAGSGAALALAANTQSGQTTLMGGSGAAVAYGNPSYAAESGTPIRGGASGGVAASTPNSNSFTLTSGAGGIAFALIETP